ncbi:hypothetical protein M6B38_236595 [Iris pallida]|uniref:Uncharacterized protein n=1 Tax=Iris pallida TaxID=29817 RepID=A0AAX6DP17_IRIPA|nr:hypothetical protein M6B38_236595 [Iris pallida]
MQYQICEDPGICLQVVADLIGHPTPWFGVSGKLSKELVWVLW